MDDTSPNVEQENHSPRLLYGPTQKPPVVIAVVLGIQHVLPNLASILALTSVLRASLCIHESDHQAWGQIALTITFVSGISTILQSTLGTRLPIIQGANWCYLICVENYLKQLECPSKVDLYAMGPESRREHWQYRIQEISGALICLSILQTFLGYSGFIGLFAQYMTPISVAPTVILLGISLTHETALLSSQNWYIAFLTVVLIALLTQILQKYKFPLPWYRISKGWHFSWILAYQMFCIVIAVLISGCVYLVFTSWEINGESSSSSELTVGRFPWFYFPYPFQWGWPIFSLNSILAIFPAMVVSIAESLACYNASASICDERPPSIRVVSRGIGTEGVCCFLAGVFGTGLGVTSQKESMGLSSVTKIGSHRVIMCGGIFMVILAIFGKAGAIFMVVPDSIVGGILALSLSMVTAEGLSILQHADLTSQRNLLIIGSSLFFGMSVPDWLMSNKDAFATGIATVDTIFHSILSGHCLVAGTLAFFLDNVLPGTDKERGFGPWRNFGRSRQGNDSSKKGAYDLPRLRPLRKTELVVIQTSSS